jgi:archaellum biogenesis ATPase FlaH
MNINLEQTILRNVLVNEEFMRKVLPFIKPEYFEGVYKSLFVELGKYVSKYNRLPTLESFKIGIDDGDFNEEQYRHAIEILPEIFKVEKIDQQWLYDTAEKWCQDRALYNAVMESISIIDGKHQSLSKNALPDILSTALGVTFDTNVGHDYIDDAEKRYEYYHTVEDKIPFDLDYFNRITKGGLPKKTLNIALAGTGVGKSLFMCHVAGSHLVQGKNVLYITMEMAEEKISERIDANLMNISMDDLHDLPKKMFTDRLSKIQSKTNGQLIIKEYPTASAHSGHFRSLIKELALKKSFKPDIIFIDYLNICGSSRFKGNANVGSYFYIKAIAEELRGLAVECNVPIMSATQTTRGGFNSSDVGLEDTSESFGLPATADLMFALITTEELEQLGQIMVKQLKNRYNDPGANKRFVLGIDRSKMKLYDVEQEAQYDIVDSGQSDTPAFDKSPISARYDKFNDIKV